MIENNDYDIAKNKNENNYSQASHEPQMRSFILKYTKCPNAIVNNNLQPERKMRVFNLSFRIYFGILAEDNKNIYFQIFCFYRFALVYSLTDSILRGINV